MVHFSALAFVILNIFCDRPLEQVSGFSDRMFLFQDVGLDALLAACHFTNPVVRFEIFFKDSRTLLVIFLDGPRRLAASQRLSSIALKMRTSNPGSSPASIVPKSLLRSRSSTSTVEKELQMAQRQWQNRELSNVCDVYISYFNTYLDLVWLFEYSQSTIGTDPKRCNPVPCLSSVTCNSLFTSKLTVTFSLGSR
jgi:hypothetical protein